jgi:glycosyltransferase involved in cell wall biosynthesis
VLQPEVEALNESPAPLAAEAADAREALRDRQRAGAPRRIAILHLGLDLKGGAENVAVWLASGLQDRGHHVTLFTDAYTPALWPAAIAGSLEVRRLRTLPWLRSIRSKRLRHWESTAYLSIALRDFDWIVGQHFPTYSWATAARRLSLGRWKVAWLCQEPARRLYFEHTDPHCQNWQSFVRPGVSNDHLDALARARRRTQQRRWRRFSRDIRWDATAARRCDRVLVNSEFTASCVRGLFGIEPELCHLGVPMPQPAARGAGDYVAVIGSLSPLKNVHNLLRAAHILVWSRGIREFRMRIAGRMEPPGALQRMLMDLGLGAHVALDGALADADLPAFYRGARLLAYCPIDEPFGLVPLEAMLVGTPCVVSDHAGPAELVEHLQTGLHVNPLDPEAIADGIERLWREPALCQRLAAAAERRASQYFSLSAFLDRFEAQLALSATAS